MLMVKCPNGQIDLKDVAQLEKWGGYTLEETKMALRAGMYAWDIAFIHKYCFDKGLILVFRTNRFRSRNNMLRFDARPKPSKVKSKTGGDVVTVDGVQYYTDYDLMSAWQDNGNKIDTNIINKDNRNFDQKSFDNINRQFHAFGQVNRIQHGANDDFYDMQSGAFLGDKYVDSSDDFLVCGAGATPEFKQTMAGLHRWYVQRGFTSDLFFEFGGNKKYMDIWPYTRG